MRIRSVAAQLWTLKLRAPFVIAARTAFEASNVLIMLTADDHGTIGYGEAAPVGYVTGESPATVLEAVSLAAKYLDGLPIDCLGPALKIVSDMLPDSPAARAGLEMALYDLWAQRWGISLWNHFGGAQECLTTDLTIPLADPEECKSVAAEAWSEGFRDFKIKAGDTAGVDADMERISAVMLAAPEARIRVDANQGFSPDNAIRFAKALARIGAPVDLLEQPVDKHDWEGLRAVRKEGRLPVFADEAATDTASVLHLLKNDAVDGINIKLMKSGLSIALEIAGLCRVWDKQLMIGCMLESPLGNTASAQIAAGIGGFGYIDLDSHRLLSPIAGLSGGFDVSGPVLNVRTEKSGWNVRPNGNILGIESD